MANYDFYITSKQCKENTKDIMRGSYRLCAKTTVLYMLLCLLPTLATVLLSVFVKWWLAIPLGILTILLVGILSYGYDAFCLNMAQEKEARVQDVFKGFSKKIGSIIKLTIKKFFLAVLWLVLFVVPFFVNFCGYSMSNFLLIDNPNINGSNALKESKHIMKKNYGKYAKFMLSFAGWFALGIISAFIGFIWIAPIININRAIYYENLKTDF